MADRIDLNGKEYVIGKMRLMDKFHVARRLGPVLTGVFKDAGEAPTSSTLIGGIAEAVAEMRQEDADFVINHCLGVVSYVQDGRPMPVMRSGGMMMFDFIDLPEMMQLVMAVLTENLGSFFPASPSLSTIAEGLPPTSSSSPSMTA